VNSNVRSATVAMFVSGGSRYESDELGGAFHFIEHMCFKGTNRRPTPQEISETIEGVGGMMNASTDREETIFWLKVASTHLPLAIDLLVDMLGDSMFDINEMEKERQVILEELAMTRDRPEDLVFQVLENTLWPNQPLGRDVGGTPTSVRGITKSNLLSCMQRQYTPQNLVLVVTGNVIHEEIIELLSHKFQNWFDGPPMKFFPLEETGSPSNISLEYRSSDSAHICLGLPALASSDPNRFALRVLNTVLGDGMSSRLFLELREKAGLVYTVNSEVCAFRDTGALFTYCATQPKNVYRSIELILREMEKLTLGVTEKEIQKAKEQIKGRILLRMEDTLNTALWIGSQELLRNCIMTPDDVTAEIDKVTTNDIVKLMELIFVQQKICLGVVGPYKSTRRFEKLLL
jgi:predicted Zn-dependent peptidase